MNWPNDDSPATLNGFLKNSLKRLDLSVSICVHLWTTCFYKPWLIQVNNLFYRQCALRPAFELYLRSSAFIRGGLLPFSFPCVRKTTLTVGEQDKPLSALEFTGERFTPECVREIFHEHFHRYACGGLVKGLDVLDCACGEGYGSRILADTARSVHRRRHRRRTASNTPAGAMAARRSSSFTPARSNCRSTMIISTRSFRSRRSSTWLNTTN